MSNETRRPPDGMCRGHNKGTTTGRRSIGKTGAVSDDRRTERRTRRRAHIPWISLTGCSSPEEWTVRPCGRALNGSHAGCIDPCDRGQLVESSSRT
jgi:hypothetical protein